ncbi:DUF4383 domain-containing protein [Streptomyces sp. SBT349]|uniref:DUF4383 domain-containing protein n=1 Tax=Streptomyces sp. SBT349 TaxID=1580539 RepID=UPI00066BD43F|nr:DUF4383 domain-containing protein [Streptomyces sp. SBT349]
MAAIHGTDPRGEPRLPHTGPRSLLRRVRLDDHLPVDRRLSRVYRIGAGLVGLGLVCFGVLGLTVGGGLFSTGDDQVWGMTTNGALSWLSIVVGGLLFGGMFFGGNGASTLNLIIGVLFVLSGFVNLVILERTANILNFHLPNVIFSFAAGLVLMTFGMYGRVSGRLPHDNPYWRARNPDDPDAHGTPSDRPELDGRRLNEGPEPRAARGGSPPRT